MCENKINRFQKPRYFLAVSIVILNLFFYGIEILAENSIFHANFSSVLFISAILILINNRWLNLILILLNIFDFISLLNYVIGRCQDNFPVNTLQNSYYWLINMSEFHWTLAYWILQISLIIYLIAEEIRIYKNKNSLV